MCQTLSVCVARCAARIPVVIEPHQLGLFFFFFNDTATTEIYTLSLHDALPICCRGTGRAGRAGRRDDPGRRPQSRGRSEEHTSELQSRQYLVCRLLLEKKKKKDKKSPIFRPTSGPTLPTARLVSSSNISCSASA